MDLGSLIIHLRVDGGELKTAEVALNNLGEAANKAAAKSATSFKHVISQTNMFAQRVRTIGYLTSAVLTAPILGAGKAVLDATKDFEYSMQMIVGLVGESQSAVDQWKESLLKMGKEVGKTPKELAEGLYFLTSSGIQGAEALNVLEISAKAATAGLGQTQEVADLLSSALNAYAGTGLTAAKAADILVAAVREGKGEADAFARSMGQIIPIAANLGVSFDQVAGAMAAMTLTGSSAANAAVYLKGVFNSLMTANDQGAKVLERAGSSYQKLRDILKSGPEGLINVLQEFRDIQMQLGDEAIKDVLPNIRALTGFMSIAGKNFQYNSKIMREITNSTGALNAAFMAMEETLKVRMDKALAGLQGSLITLGKDVAPTIVEILEELTGLLDRLTEKWNTLTDAQKRFRLIGVAAVAAIGPLALLLSSVIYIVSGIVELVYHLGTGFKKLGETLKRVGFVMQYYSFVGYTEAMKKIPNMTSLTSSAMLGLGKVVGGLSEAVSVLGGAFLALPLLPIAAGLALFISEHIKATKAAKEMKNVLDRVNSSISDEEVKLGLAFNQLRNTTQGTNDRAEAIDLINNRYGEYLNNMLTEKSSLEDITDAQNQVTLAITKRIATESLQAEKAKQINKIAAAQHKYLGDYIVKYQKSLEVMGKMPMKSAELTSSFMNDLNETIDFMVRQMPRDIAASEAVRVKVNINPLASFDKKDIDVTNAALQDYLDASLKDFMKLKDGAFDLEEAISIVNSSVQEAGLAWKVFDGFYEKYLKPLNISMEEARNAFADFIEVRKQADPIIKALDLEIQGYSGVALKAAEAAEAVRNLAEEQSNPVLKKILEDMQRQESSLIKMKNAFKNAGISTEEVNSKLINLYKTAQEDLGATGLKEAVPVIKTLDELINALTLNLQKSGISLDEIVQDFAAESEYLKYMAVRAHKLGIEFDYIGENGKLLQKTLEELGKIKGLDTAFAVNRAEELANLPASLFPVEQALKNLKEQFKFFEGKGKIDIEFDVTTEKIRAVEEARDKLLEVRKTARNIEKTPVIIGFDFAMPAAPLLDFVIKNLTKDLDELKTAQQNVIDAKTLSLLDAEANAFGTIAGKVDVLTYQLQAAKRKLRELLQEQLNPKSNQIISDEMIKNAVENIQKVKYALQELESAMDIKYYEDMYNAWGSSANALALLDANISAIESKLRALSEQGLENTFAFEMLTDRLKELKAVSYVVDTLSNAFGELVDALITGSETAADALKRMVTQMISDLIKLVVKMAALKIIMTILFPEMSAAQTTAAAFAGAAGIPKFAGGGIIPPGYPNDTYPALLSSGEMVLPKNIVTNLNRLSKQKRAISTPDTNSKILQSLRKQKDVRSTAAIGTNRLRSLQKVDRQSILDPKTVKNLSKVAQIKTDYLSNINKMMNNLSSLKDDGIEKMEFYRNSERNNLVGSDIPRNNTDVVLPNLKGNQNPLSNLTPVENNIKITLDGAIRNKDIALVIRKMERFN